MVCKEQPKGPNGIVRAHEECALPLKDLLIERIGGHRMRRRLPQLPYLAEGAHHLVEGFRVRDRPVPVIAVVRVPRVGAIGLEHLQIESTVPELWSESIPSIREALADLHAQAKQEKDAIARIRETAPSPSSSRRPT